MPGAAVAGAYLGDELRVELPAGGGIADCIRGDAGGVPASREPRAGTAAAALAFSRPDYCGLFHCRISARHWNVRCDSLRSALYAGSAGDLRHAFRLTTDATFDRRGIIEHRGGKYYQPHRPLPDIGSIWLG